MVGRKSGFIAFRGHDLAVAYAAGIVDQHVDPRRQRLDLLGHAQNVGHDVKVAAHEVDLGLGRSGGADLRFRGGGAFGMAAGADHVPALLGEHARGGFAYAGAGAGDDGDALAVVLSHAISWAKGCVSWGRLRPPVRKKSSAPIMVTAAENSRKGW